MQSESEFRTVIRAVLEQSGQTLTTELLREKVQQFAVVYGMDEHEIEREIRFFEALVGVSIDTASTLIDETHVEWLEAAKPGIVDFYWNRYRRYLTKRLPPAVVNEIDRSTDTILGLLGDPESETGWDRRGLVLGHVQSGKTSNYIGLITKAADAGYKLVIVLAGLHNHLRNQTQQRIDEGFIGRDSSALNRLNNRPAFVGVGLDVGENAGRFPVSLTSTEADFSVATANQLSIPIESIMEPLIFVVKKNPTTLRTLDNWIRKMGSSKLQGLSDLPLLLIDDEADNASINTRYSKAEVTTINSLVRRLMLISTKSCYVGYTATPFANIFVDPENEDEMFGQDLFPRSFLVSLDPPSNYFGPNKVFLEEPSRFTRSIDDNGDLLPVRHKKEFRVKDIPESLAISIRTFVLARTMRMIRGDGREHSTMLVNASRFQDVHFSLRDAIHSELAELQQAVKLYAGLPVEDALQYQELSRLYQVWSDEYSDNGIEWDEIQANLVDAVAAMRVAVINRRSPDRIDFAKEANAQAVIVVGGLSLSRGLTLPGLVVSYLLRNTAMYDTLLQMGRWFGYRSGYEDLCRVWLRPETRGWYEHIAESVVMLRNDIRSMEQIGASPSEFGLKVRQHPDSLLITARNKLGSAASVAGQVGLAGSFEETTRLHADHRVLEQNFNAAKDLVRLIHSDGHQFERGFGGLLVKNVSYMHIEAFLNNFRNHPASPLTESKPVLEYILARTDSELGLWDVLYSSRNEQKDESADTSLGIPIYRQRRTVGNTASDDVIVIGTRQRISSRGVERNGLSPEAIANAEATYRASRKSSDGAINYPDYIYREQRIRPLLVVHLLELRLPDTSTFGNSVVAWGVSFPKTTYAQKTVRFMVNRTYMEQGQLFLEEYDDEDIDDE